MKKKLLRCVECNRPADHPLCDGCREKFVKKHRKPNIVRESMLPEREKILRRAVRGAMSVKPSEENKTDGSSSN